MHKKKISWLLLAGALLLCTAMHGQDKNFHIYLCFGQSNMEGNAKFETQDTIVDERFQVLEAVDCPNLNRVMGKWYTARPPLCRCRTGLGPADYFGRVIVARLPSNIRVGVVNVVLSIINYPTARILALPTYGAWRT